jgi:hypothetical protein
MERAVKEDIKVSVTDPEITWKKIGGGPLILKNRIIKPGEKFKARIDEIPMAFRDVVIPLQDLKISPVPEIISKKVSTYHLEPKGNSKSLFNVVDTEGKVLNENGLKKEIAEQFIVDLEK